MPKECLDCGFVSVNDYLSQCDRCGGERLRFSMLAGMKFRDKEAKAVRAKVGADDRPTWRARVGQGFSYLVWAQATVFILCGSVLFATPDDELPKNRPLAELLETAGEVYPALYVVAAILLPSLGAGAAVVFALKGVYLAQQVGLFLGPVCALVSLFALAAVGGWTPIVAWFLAPALAAGLSFFAGLRMTGYVRAPSESDAKVVEYKPVDSWDRGANARFFDLRVARQGHFRKLSIGLIAGAIANFLLPFLLASMSGAADGELARARLIFGWLSVCIAGAFAAAGTNAPLLQGSLAGALMYIVRHYSSLLIWTPEVLLQFWLHIAVGILGGVAGRLFFPPARIAKGRKRCESDGVVYVGDELVKNTA